MKSNIIQSIRIILIFFILSSCHSKKHDHTTPFQLSHIKNKDIQNDIERGEFNTNKLENPLQSAVYRNDIDAVKLLLKNGYDVHFVGSYSGNLLNIAARFSSIEMNKFLIEQGVDINVNDDIGRSPISLACRYRTYEFLKLFLDNGADLKKSITDPLRQIYKRSGGGGDKMIQLLIDNGFDINQDLRGMMHYNLGYDTAGLFELLINNGLRFNETDEHGWTAMHWAAYYNAYNCAELLMNYPELNCGTAKAYEYHTFANYDEKFVYEAGLFPEDIAKINKHTETLQVLKQ